MEKVHILEMTVRYIKSVRQVTKGGRGGGTIGSNFITPASESSRASPASCYFDGYQQCAVECANFLSLPDANQNFHTDIKDRLLQHLSTCLNTISGSLDATGKDGFLQQPISDVKLPSTNHGIICDREHLDGFYQTPRSLPITFPAVFTIVPHQPATAAAGNTSLIITSNSIGNSTQPSMAALPGNYGGVIPLYACSPPKCLDVILPPNTILQSKCSPTPTACQQDVSNNKQDPGYRQCSPAAPENRPCPLESTIHASTNSTLKSERLTPRQGDECPSSSPANMPSCGAAPQWKDLISHAAYEHLQNDVWRPWKTSDMMQ